MNPITLTPKKENGGAYLVDYFESEPTRFSELGELAMKNVVNYIKNYENVSEGSVVKVLNRHNPQVRFSDENKPFIGNTPSHGGDIKHEMIWQEKTFSQKVFDALMPREWEWRDSNEPDTTRYGSIAELLTDGQIDYSKCKF